MKTIKVTPALRSAIYQAARRRVFGASPLFEVGLRKMAGADRDTANARLWEEDADLSDFEKLKDLKTLDLDDTGRCELDLYATTTTRRGPGGMSGRELETNVYILLDEMGVIDTADVGTRHRVNWGSL